jgi:hypothetical protein
MSIFDFFFFFFFKAYFGAKNLIFKLSVSFNSIVPTTTQRKRAIYEISVRFSVLVDLLQFFLPHFKKADHSRKILMTVINVSLAT